MKSHPVVAELFHGGRTDIHDEAIAASRNFANKPKANTTKSFIICSLH